MIEVGLTDVWTILTLFLVANACSMVGVYLVLRKAPLLGDAVSHSVLPGIAVAFYLGRGFNATYTLIGASVFGVIATYLIQGIASKFKVRYEAAMGMVFTFMFAVGVVLIAYWFKGQADIDQDCVLNGNIDYVIFHTWLLNGVNLGPVTMYQLLGVNLILVTLILLFGKLLKLFLFDATFARMMKLPTGIVNLVFYTLVSVVIVFSFEVVGVILVVGFMIIPPIVALLLTNRMRRVFRVMIIFNISAIITAYIFAYQLNLPLGASVITTEFMGLLGLVIYQRSTKYKAVR